MDSKAPQCPIPQGVVAYITGANDKVRRYLLWKNEDLVVIQAPPLPHLAGPPDSEPDTEYNPEIDKMFFYGLEEIQTVIHTIEFGKTNWGYLVHNPARGYEVMQKQKTLPKVTCGTWTRLVSRREITFTRFWDIGGWNGYWKGQEVDVFMAYDAYSIDTLDREMWGYLALQGLDLTYEALGHVVEDDGTIVGLMFKPTVGRLLEYRDRALAYNALARIQARGLVFCGAQEYTNFTVMHGKIRITNLASIWYFPDEKRRNEEADIRHWQTLERWFPVLKYVPENRAKTVIQRCVEQNVLLLPRLSPERPLFIRFVLEPYKEAERAKLNNAIITWLRKDAPRRKRLSLSNGRTHSSRDIDWGVTRRAEDLGRHNHPDQAIRGRIETLPSDCDTESTYYETEVYASK
ncbi:hypothetical protein LshimejAT787_1701500 [Lyophyllum shimeji]|uniref:Uncharacterized protein n=1 Tax=Lyophyllum shimeji TaxID=47721 RepID=A0A9P3PZR3_LYOSH|nr:hypothetical protein LshimejAT787_1701500 [Lyophyllum shimeji]